MTAAFAAALLAASVPAVCSATQVDYTGISIDQVRVFTVAYGPYRAGDWEMTISFPNAPPASSLNCPNRLTITTHAANDPQRRMLERAKEVQFGTLATVSITVTDDPLVYAGRCSLVAIQY